MKTPDPRSPYVEAASVCAAYNLRKASRIATQIFDDALEAVGLRSTQYTLMLVISLHEGPSIVRLSREMVMDPSTLNRNLKPLVTRGLVDVLPAASGRAKVVRLTDAGQVLLAAALPHWERAQVRVLRRFGKARWSRLRDQLVMLTNALGTDDRR